MFPVQPQHARRQVGLVRLLLLLALLPLLRLPMPVLHTHEDWPETGAFSVSLAEHIHQFHHDADESEGHWHFVQLGDLGWLGMSFETQLFNNQYFSGRIERLDLHGLVLSTIWHFPDCFGNCLLLPPNLRLYRTIDFLPCHGLSSSSRTFLVQLLCEQQC